MGRLDDNARAGGRTVAELLDRRLAGADRPFLTFYDDARGDRVELSYKTFANWVGKVANLLGEEYGAGAGDRVVTVAGVHWQASAIHVACWYAGATVVVAPPPEGGDAAAAERLRASSPALVFAREEWLDEVRAAVDAPVVALCADPFGRPARELGATPNFSRIVPAMPDFYDGEPADRDAEALVLDPAGAVLRQGDLVAEATAVAGSWGLAAADRVLSTVPDDQPGGVAAGLLAPLTVGAGTVRDREFSAAAFWPRVAGEHVTVANVTAAEAAALLDVAPSGGDRPDRLRLVVCAGEDPPAGLAAAWQERVGVPLTPAAALAPEPGQGDPGAEAGRAR